MAIIHMGANQQHLEAEARVVHETNKKAARQKRDAKKGFRLFLIHSLLILISIGLLLSVLLWPGMLSNILSTVKETMNSWRGSLSDYILMPESRERPEHAVGMVWLGILLALDWVLRTVCKVLLAVLGWTAPVWIVGGMILIVFLIVRYSCIVISDNWSHKQKKEEIKDHVIRSLSKKVAKDYAESQGEQQALAVLTALSDECHIFTNLEISCNGEICKSDLVVVSPSGVTVVEVTNHSGLLFGDLSERELHQWEHLNTKIHKEKNHTENKVQNPAKKSGEQACKLTRYLKEKGMDVLVQGCVLFTHEKVQLHVTDHKDLAKKCPLFLSHDPDFLDYVHSAACGALSPAMIQQIVAAFKEENYGYNL